ncbi:MAG: hypothetical protein KKD44_23380 [Proteobacteria bacterium]|nr:hypothetical protein [Pseudomonadota bacterium]
MMNSQKILFVIICFCLWFILAGCGKQKTEEIYPMPDESLSKIKTLENEVETLSSKLKKVNQELQVLGAENERLSGRYSELGEWADRTVSRFGPGIWYMGDLTYPFFIKPVKSGNLTEIINELNQRFRKDKLPEVIFLEKEKNTVIVGVSDDDQLSRKMGSFGATSYMNAVVFSLASPEDVSCVTFKFEEGDHAVPGTYCRDFLKK